MWNPWRGCRRYSEGCKYCYIHKGDARRGVDTGVIRKTPQFDAPIARGRNGAYQIKSGSLVYLCFSSDFLLEEADGWRAECWQMMRARPDLHFLFLTKRILRLPGLLPPDWGGGYENVTIGCTVEDQARAEERLSVFLSLPIRHRNIICQPMLGPMDLRPYLSGAELVVVGGESDPSARPLDYDWVLDLRQQCVDAGVSFRFRQCSTHFVKDGTHYTIPTQQLTAQARKAGIDWRSPK